MRSLNLLTCFFFLLNLLSAQNNLPDEMPYFAGCTALKQGSKEKRQCSNDALVRYLTNNLQYPDTARTLGIEGKVYAEFDITTEGKVQHCIILNDIGGNCGQEARRIIETMPTWEPAQKNKRAFQTKLYLPIVFALNDEKNSPKNAQLMWGNVNKETISIGELKDYANLPVLARDMWGNNLPISTLTFQYEKGQKAVKAESIGTMNTTIVRFLNNIKTQGDLIVEVTLQQNGQFVTVSRSYLIVK
jgi:TonB family protein